MGSIYEELKRYGDSDFYPFHMPGHKRRLGWIRDPFSIDITEIDGFDNLHCAEGIILEAQKRMADLYGARESFFLVNGSTCGILSAISACVKRGGKILMARNSHKSAYHGVFLRDLEAVYLYPKVIESYGINGGYDKAELAKMLETDPEIEAVFLTSPTYDGIVSDIKGIAEIVHRYHIPLIVDEAHGAHFGIASGFPKSAVEQGADLVIQSLHKTLPCLTQAAVIHRNGSLVSGEKLKKFLQIYQTSSPSYVLIAAIDQCAEKMKKNGTEMLESLKKNVEDFHTDTRNLSVIKIPSLELKGKDGVFDFDISKLILSVRGSKKSGNWLLEELRKAYHLELEMAAGDYALAMATVGDCADGLKRLSQALHEIDKKLNDEKTEGQGREDKSFELQRLECAVRISRVEEAALMAVSWEKGVGGIAGEYAYLYPPGIPLIVPGERITEELVRQIQVYHKKKFRIQGLADPDGNTIRICM